MVKKWCWSLCIPTQWMNVTKRRKKRSATYTYTMMKPNYFRVGLRASDHMFIAVSSIHATLQICRSDVLHWLSLSSFEIHTVPHQWMSAGKCRRFRCLDTDPNIVQTLSDRSLSVWFIVWYGCPSCATLPINVGAMLGIVSGLNGAY